MRQSIPGNFPYGHTLDPHGIDPVCVEIGVDTILEEEL
jgi:hypothetical protein